MRQNPHVVAKVAIFINKMTDKKKNKSLTNKVRRCKERHKKTKILDPGRPEIRYKQLTMNRHGPRETRTISTLGQRHTAEHNQGQDG